MFNNIEAYYINEDLKRYEHDHKQKIINISIFLHTKVLSDARLIIKEPIDG